MASLLLVAGGLFVQTTLASNISINTGASVEFGQGMTQAVACSGTTELLVTPHASFVNGSEGSGLFYFTSVTVSNVPTTCYGQDFSVSAYGNTNDAPLYLFNSNSTNAVVHFDQGIFRLGFGSRGLSLSRGADSFTVTFKSPAALATSVLKITVESSEHREWMDLYSVGDVGPGGGIIFYVDVNGFSCGSSFSNTGSPNGTKCFHLEAAPRGWISGTTRRSWAEAGFWLTRVPSPGATLTAIGSGYRNTLAIINQGNSDPSLSAAALAQSFRGGQMTDWYLPSKDELHELYLKRDLVADSLFSPHWSSSESSSTADENLAWFQSFSNGTPDIFGKISDQFHVFPVRAF